MGLLKGENNYYSEDAIKSIDGVIRIYENVIHAMYRGDLNPLKEFRGSFGSPDKCLFCIAVNIDCSKCIIGDGNHDEDKDFYPCAEEETYKNIGEGFDLDAPDLGKHIEERLEFLKKKALENFNGTT